VFFCLFLFCFIIISFVASQGFFIVHYGLNNSKQVTYLDSDESDESDTSPNSSVDASADGSADTSPDGSADPSGSTPPKDEECANNDENSSDDYDSSESSRQVNHPLIFSDGFKCGFYNFNFNALVDCYMSYFGFDHGGGFKGCQRSVLDLKGIFDFVEHHTSCDLINEPDNTKCKETHTSHVPSDSASIEDSSNDFSTIPESHKRKLDIVSSPEKVVIKYAENTYGDMDMFANDKSDKSESAETGEPEGPEEGEDQGPSSGSFLFGGGFGMMNLGSLFGGHEKATDGKEFPMRDGGNSMKVVKEGKYNANYTIEINAVDGRFLVAFSVTQTYSPIFRK